MATRTTNLSLIKPDYDDAADIAVINANMDTLDTTIKAIQDILSGDDGDDGEGGNRYLPIAGGTMTGALIAPSVTVTTTLNIPGGKIWIG